MAQDRDLLAPLRATCRHSVKAAAELQAELEIR
jgi:hypothetical protein